MVQVCVSFILDSGLRTLLALYEPEYYSTLVVQVPSTPVLSEFTTVILDTQTVAQYNNKSGGDERQEELRPQFFVRASSLEGYI